MMWWNDCAICCTHFYTPFRKMSILKIENSSIVSCSLEYLPNKEASSTLVNTKNDLSLIQLSFHNQRLDL